MPVSLLGRVDYWMATLFIKGVDPGSVESMDFHRLRYWSGIWERHIKATKQNA
jgi:hypothetical protein